MELMEVYKAEDFSTSSDKTDFLGKGSFATVRRCVHCKLGKVVVKCFTITGSPETIKKHITETKNEVEVLFRISHKNIVSFYGTTQWLHGFGLVLEELAGYNLEDLIIYNQDKNIPWILRLQFFFELASALDYLHYHDPKKRYIHGDVKPQNILLNDNLALKLADFGAVSIANATGVTTASLILPQSRQCTFFYTAPEYLKKPFLSRTSAMDVYSFGMIGYELVTRHAVFRNSEGNLNVIQDAIAQRGIKPDSKHIDQVEQKLKIFKDRSKCNDYKIFQKLRKWMIVCWNTKPKNRPEMKNVKANLQAFFKEVQDLRKDENLELKHLKKPIQLDYSSKLISLSNFEPPFEFASNISTEDSSLISKSTGPADLETSIYDTKSAAENSLVEVNTRRSFKNVGKRAPAISSPSDFKHVLHTKMDPTKDFSLEIVKPMYAADANIKRKVFHDSGESAKEKTKTTVTPAGLNVYMSSQPRSDHTRSKSLLQERPSSSLEHLPQSPLSPRKTICFKKNNDGSPENQVSQKHKSSLRRSHTTGSQLEKHLQTPFFEFERNKMGDGRSLKRSFARKRDNTNIRRSPTIGEPYNVMHHYHFKEESAGKKEVADIEDGSVFSCGDANKDYPIYSSPDEPTCSKNIPLHRSHDHVATESLFDVSPPTSTDDIFPTFPPPPPITFLNEILTSPDFSKTSFPFPAPTISSHPPDGTDRLPPPPPPLRTDSLSSSSKKLP